MLKKENIRLLLSLMGLLVLSRLIPHWPNVTALGAVSLLAPHWLRSEKLALAIPLLALFISDAVIGFHSTMLFTYAAVFLVSWFSLKSRTANLHQAGTLIFSSFAASMIFFLITNLGAWLTLDMYQKSLSGLLLSYWNALPFFGYEFLGTIVYLGGAITAKNLVCKIQWSH